MHYFYDYYNSWAKAQTIASVLQQLFDHIYFIIELYRNTSTPLRAWYLDSIELEFCKNVYFVDFVKSLLIEFL